MAKAPPAGIYVPAVIFFDENDELDIPSIQAHVLRLAQVRFMFMNRFLSVILIPCSGRRDGDISSRIKWRSTAPLSRRKDTGYPDHAKDPGQQWIPKRRGDRWNGCSIYSRNH